jgi:hypothetical protein
MQIVSALHIGMFYAAVRSVFVEIKFTSLVSRFFHFIHVSYFFYDKMIPFLIPTGSHRVLS